MCPAFVHLRACHMGARWNMCISQCQCSRLRRQEMTEDRGSPGRDLGARGGLEGSRPAPTTGNPDLSVCCLARVVVSLLLSVCCASVSS
eukprot:870373-Rhodomonas_salina.1